jgi:heme/copper-type cytochrome/quinol oxidase subunit 2
MLPPNVRAIIRQVTEVIEKSTDKAERGADDRSKRTNESQKEVGVAIQFLADEFGRYQAKQTESERSKNRRENLTIASLVITAVITLALAILAGLQWGTLEKTDHTLKDTLTSSNVTNRPFVFAKGVTIDQTVMRGYWTFAIPVENSGNTPTREMESLTISSQNAPGDPEDIFVRTPKSAYDAPGVIPQRWGGSLLGPKAQTHLLGSQTGLPSMAVSKMADDRQNYYISGVIHYRDAFAGTPAHVTKFCYVVVPYKEGTETRVSYDRCLYWNCADEDCKADRERYDHDFKVANTPKGPN